MKCFLEGNVIEYHGIALLLHKHSHNADPYNTLKLHRLCRLLIVIVITLPTLLTAQCNRDMYVVIIAQVVLFLREVLEDTPVGLVDECL
jgi:hypothetical protein